MPPAPWCHSRDSDAGSHASDGARFSDHSEFGSGTAGVAAAQVQGVLERIGSFGLLGAIGFPPARLRAIVLLETCFMVGLGLAAGALAGAVTLPAHIAGGRASVPLAWIALTCGLTLLVALLAGLLATRSVARLAPRDALAARGGALAGLFD